MSRLDEQVDIIIIDCRIWSRLGYRPSIRPGLYLQLFRIHILAIHDRE